LRGPFTLDGGSELGKIAGVAAADCTFRKSYHCLRRARYRVPAIEYMPQQAGRLVRADTAYGAASNTQPESALPLSEAR
jgi:hypothetical protein